MRSVPEIIFASKHGGNLKFAICVFVLWLSPVTSVISSAAEKPVVLYSGLGSWHHPIATKNADAQKFFDQGLTLVYSFNRYEALRSFRRAAELDPEAAMAYWGIAMAQGPYVNMDGDPSFDLKGACTAVHAGLYGHSESIATDRQYCVADSV